MSSEENKDESFISHLEALRSTLLKCLWAIVIVLPFTFYFAPKILDLLIKIITNSIPLKLNYFHPVEVFMIQIKIALVIDVIICFPYIAKQLWNFVLPALYEHEKKSLKTILLISCLLFLSGMLFALFVILPLIINFGLSFATENIQAMFRISDIINLVLWMSVVFGIMFQVPVITYYLIKTDIISYESIADKRPYVVVMLLILSAFLTPPDIISQLVLGIPTYLLFEAGLLVSRFKRKKIQ